MSKLVWDAETQHFYETGVDHGVLYTRDAKTGAYKNGYVWNGLTAVNETPSGADATDLYADNIKYLSLRAAETFGGTIEAYMFPPEFAECDGSATVTEGVTIGQQPRKSFGLSYRTILGNDVLGNDYAYKLHLVYGCTASPSERSYSSVNDSPDAITFSWEFDTVPVPVNGYAPTALLTIDSSKADPEKLKALEDILYGTEETEARLPLPDEVFELLSPAA